MSSDPIAAAEDRQLRLLSDALSAEPLEDPLASAGSGVDHDRDQSGPRTRRSDHLSPMSELLVYDYDRAAAALGISTSFLRKQVMAGRIMHSKLGRSVRFTRAHLDAYLAATEQPVVSRRHRRRL